MHPWCRFTPNRQLTDPKLEQVSTTANTVKTRIDSQREKRLERHAKKEIAFLKSLLKIY
jgi:hypothetical protein